MVPLSYCVLIPRGVCPRCREKAAGLLDRAKRSGRYAHILCIDEDSTRNTPKKPWPLKEKIWR